MKKTLIPGITILLTTTILSINYAQTPQSYSYADKIKQHQIEINKFTQKRNSDFMRFHKERNAEFAKMMRQRWEDFNSFQAIPVPSKPKPRQPRVKTEPVKPLPVVLDFSKIRTADIGKTIQPRVKVIPDAAQTPQNNLFHFAYQQTECKVPLDERYRFTLESTDNNSCANIWDKLSSLDIEELISGCLELKENMRLNDWGYIDMCRTMTNRFFPDHSNESRLLQMFILTQSGYKVRLARSGNQLFLLVPFEPIVYSYDYLDIDQLRYYILDEGSPSGSYQVLNIAFPEEQTPSLIQKEVPVFTYEPVKEIKTFSSFSDGTAIPTIQPNQNLINYYKTYPISNRWDYYVQTSLSDGIKDKLYPYLREKISGKSEKEAVEVLLDFLQHKFEYKTDHEQFGYEKPMFGDESFFYPYNDCEDRAILLAIFVRELLGLDVVLLNYPSHLSTAIRFNQDDISGSYFNLEKGKYFCCDPTYYGAGVGESMPQLKEVKAEIIEL